MASSKRRNSSKGAAADLESGVAAQLSGLVKPGDHLVAALSGGVDSVVLLDVLARLSVRLGFRVSALHVNHQLSPNAGRWAAFCARICRARGIPVRIVKVNVKGGDGPEGGARAARYEVFARQRCNYVVVAHHQDDQVETLLLQLLRGAGVPGLAGMPFLRGQGRGPRAEGNPRKTASSDCSGPAGHPSSLISRPSIMRPLLGVTRGQILAYARERRLRWVEDESNADVDLQRNFLRHEVLPLIARRFPAYRTTVSRAARHLAEASDALAELALADQGAQFEEGTLEVSALSHLSSTRAINVLRHFLAGHGIRMPSTVRLHEILRQTLGAKEDARLRIDLATADLWRFNDRLHVVRKLAAENRRAPARMRPPEDSTTSATGSASDALRRWRGEHRVQLPELGGFLMMTRCRGRGLSLARLRGRPVTIRLRRGGERLKPDPRRPRRTLKNLLQEACVPPWVRARMPLVFCGDDLIWAPHIGADCAYLAGPRERAVFPAWIAFNAVA
jgi:tRNA(Ile)-lysidine synthase